MCRLLIVVMAARSLEETKRVRYLLGMSPSADREQVELQYFADDDAFEDMLATEDELIDAYARSELTDEERRRFEESYGSSLRRRNRVQFANAFADTLSATKPVDTQLPAKFLDIFQSPVVLRTATIAVVIVFVAVLVWLVNDRRKMTNELRELQAHTTKLSKQMEALQRSNNTNQTRTAETAASHTEPQVQESKIVRRVTTNTRQAPHSSEAKSVSEKVAAREPQPAEVLLKTENASIGNTLTGKSIMELPVQGRSVEDLLSLQPATTPGIPPEGRADQAGLTLDGVNLNPYSLMPRHSGSFETTLLIPESFTWIRFELALYTAAIHEDERITITTADGRLITSVDWIEPLTPDQTIIETPAISTADLPSGDYVLLLMGKEPDGSFSKIAEYSFKIIRHR